MKLPTLDQALSVIQGLATIAGPEAVAAVNAAGLIISLFDEQQDQDHLKEAYAQAQADTDNALDALETALAEAKAAR